MQSSSQLDDGTVTVSGLVNGSLSYNCLANNMSHGQDVGLFLTTAANANTMHHLQHKPNCLLSNATNSPISPNNDSDSYNFLNQNHMRRSIFMTNNFQKVPGGAANSNATLLLPSSNTLIMPRALTSHTGINKFNQAQFVQCLKLNANNTSQTSNLISSDPLGHIYETISVSSGSNGGGGGSNFPNQTNKFKTNGGRQQQQHQQLSVDSTKNAYNELEFDYKPAVNSMQQAITVDNNNTSLSLTESTESNGQSPKSQELFLISSSNTAHTNNRKSMSRKSASNNHRFTSNNNENNLLTSQQQIPSHFLQHHQQQQQQNTIFKQTNGRVNSNNNNNNTAANRMSEMSIQNAILMNQSSQNLINNNSPPSCSSSIATTATTASSFDSSCPILSHHQMQHQHQQPQQQQQQQLLQHHPMTTSRFFVNDQPFSSFNNNNSINSKSNHSSFGGGQLGGYLSQQQQLQLQQQQFQMISEQHSDGSMLFASRSEAVV
jgi:hypothetical protein